jgi:hypothetical protein
VAVDLAEAEMKEVVGTPGHSFDLATQRFGRQAAARRSGVEERANGRNELATERTGDWLARFILGAQPCELRIAADLNDDGLHIGAAHRRDRRDDLGRRRGAEVLEIAAVDDVAPD